MLVPSARGGGRVERGAVLHFAPGSTDITQSTAWDRLQGPGNPVRVSRTVLRRIFRDRAGMAHNCALTAGAQLLCWGQNTDGELGDGTGVNHTTPVSPVGGLRFP